MHRHGGARAGAGRPATSRRVSHSARPAFDGERQPLHVTLRTHPKVWNLRSQRGFACVAHALRAEQTRGELRVVHFSVQGNHVHMIVEADDRETLSRRMQGFGVRLARRVNAMMGRRRGRVLGDRYHSRVLGSARDVRNVIRYVLENHAKHAAQAGRTTDGRPDRFASSGHALDERTSDAIGTGPPLVSAPFTRLLGAKRRRGYQPPRGGA